MSDQLDKKSILEMSMGAILERVDYEMGKVMDNILDPNTKATAKRKISVTLELIPRRGPPDHHGAEHGQVLPDPDGPRDHEPLHHQRTQHRRAAGGRNGAPGPRPVSPRR